MLPLINIKRFEFVYKPSSVVYGHLSRFIVADKLKRYSRRPSSGQPYMTGTQSCSKWGLHGIPCYHSIGELLPRLSILTGKTLRFISVALSLKSPSPDVIRHFVLYCSDFPHCHKRHRDRITNSNLLYYSTFFSKSHSILLLFLRKNSKIKLIFFDYTKGNILSWSSYEKNQNYMHHWSCKFR